jgi:hypothetical protein
VYVFQSDFQVWGSPAQLTRQVVAFEAVAAIQHAYWARQGAAGDQRIDQLVLGSARRED